MKFFDAPRRPDGVGWSETPIHSSNVNKRARTALLFTRQRGEGGAAAGAVLYGRYEPKEGVSTNEHDYSEHRGVGPLRAPLSQTA